MTSQKYRNLKTRLFLIVFSSTALIGSCTVLLMFFIAYQNQLQEGEEQVNQLMDTVEYSAAIASYSSNDEIAQDVINGLLRSDNVCQARLYNNTGLNVAKAKHSGIKSCSTVILHPLHSPFDASEIVGHIETRIDSPVITARAYRQAGQLALSLLALVLLPGVVIWWAISRFITSPIHHLSQQLHQLTPGTHTRISVIKRETTHEIGQLARDINHLLGLVEITLSEEREQRFLVEKMEQKYQHLAHHDTLTGLPNRALFSDRLQQMLAQSQRKKVGSALIYLDLDNFKPVNDTLGHDIGDLLLVEVALRIQSCVRASDTVARMGGDEFVVLLSVIENQLDAGRVAEKIRLALTQTFTLQGHTINIGSSIGIAIYPEHGEDEITLIKNADTAMYQAKQNGRNNVQVYHTGIIPLTTVETVPEQTW